MTRSIKTSKLKGKSGQAALEYILLTGAMVLIFSLVFRTIRENLFYLWVCDLAPRIQAAKACGPNTKDCYDHIVVGADNKDVEPAACK